MSQTHMTAIEYVEASRLAWSEAQFKDELIREVTSRGWLVAHFRPAKTEKGWRTPMQGHAGFPDLVLARDGVVLFVELKSEHARPSPEQKIWLAHTGGEIWRPSDWPAILERLA